ncbi:MAG: CIA30 family protein [Myxococcota bacterium]
MTGDRRQSRVRWGARRLLMILILTLGSLGLLNTDDDHAAAAGTTDLRNMPWVTVNDTVMGGRSSATVSWNDAGQLIWSGNLSLENNGGFVSIRSRSPWSDWSSYDGVEVVLEGAGREIQVSAQRGDRVMRAGGYRAMLPTEVRGDTRVFIPFSAFVLKRFGREVAGPSLPDGLRSVGDWGLLMADKREGAFQVTLKSITPARHTKDTRTSPKVRATLIKAIERGVPVFNAGDPKGCAAIYGEVLQQLVGQGLLGPRAWAHQVSRAALTRATSQSDTDAAWTLRRAIDAILRSLPG